MLNERLNQKKLVDKRCGKELVSGQMTWSSTHTRAMLSLLVVTPLGFAFKFYPGPGNWWFNNYGAGVLYEIFWILLAFLLFPSKRSANVISVYVFLISYVLEFLQLWHPPFVEMIRSSSLGSGLMGPHLYGGIYPIMFSVV